MKATPVLTINVVRNGDRFRAEFDASWLYGDGRHSWPSPQFLTPTRASVPSKRSLRRFNGLDCTINEDRSRKLTQ
jgi:hypothetical protein